MDTIYNLTELKEQLFDASPEIKESFNTICKYFAGDPYTSKYITEISNPNMSEAESKKVRKKWWTSFIDDSIRMLSAMKDDDSLTYDVRIETEMNLVLKALENVSLDKIDAKSGRRPVWQTGFRFR